MIKATTTLRRLKECDACQDGLETLIKHLGEDYPDDRPINLLTILDSNGLQHCLWAFRATVENHSNELRLIAADCAESVLYIYENKYPNDDRPRKAIEAARIDTAACAAACAAASAAACAAASAASYAADYAASAAASAASYAADYAASCAACAADYAAAASAAADSDTAKEKEREKQKEIIKKYLEY